MGHRYVKKTGYKKIINRMQATQKKENKFLQKKIIVTSFFII